MKDHRVIFSDYKCARMLVHEDITLEAIKREDGLYSCEYSRGVASHLRIYSKECCYDEEKLEPETPFREHIRNDIQEKLFTPTRYYILSSLYYCPTCMTYRDGPSVDSDFYDLMEKLWCSDRPNQGGLCHRVITYEGLQVLELFAQTRGFKNSVLVSRCNRCREQRRNNPWDVSKASKEVRELKELIYFDRAVPKAEMKANLLKGVRRRARRHGLTEGERTFLQGLIGISQLNKVINQTHNHANRIHSCLTA